MTVATRTHADANFRFDVPADWVDRSIVVWSAPADAAAVPPNFVIAYDRPHDGEGLGEYVTRQIGELGRTADGFQLDVRRDLPFGGRPAVEVTFRWAAGPGTMQQRQIFSILPDGRVASIASTAAAADFAAADATFLEILKSFRWAA